MKILVKVCPRCEGLGEEAGLPSPRIEEGELIALCSQCNGKGVVPTKTPKLSVETCSFIPITSVKALIKSKRALNELGESLCNGSVSYGDSNRTMTTIDYILNRIRDAVENSKGIEMSFNKAIVALEEARANGVQYVDLEN